MTGTVLIELLVLQKVRRDDDKQGLRMPIVDNKFISDNHVDT